MGFATISGKEKAIRSGAEMSNKYRARELKPERIYLWGAASQLSAPPELQSVCMVLSRTFMELQYTLGMVRRKF